MQLQHTTFNADWIILPLKSSEKSVPTMSGLEYIKNHTYTEKYSVHNLDLNGD